MTGHYLPNCEMSFLIVSPSGKITEKRSNRFFFPFLKTSSQILETCSAPEATKKKRLYNDDYLIFQLRMNQLFLLLLLSLGGEYTKGGGLFFFLKLKKKLHRMVKKSCICDKKFRWYYYEPRKI